jgi:hypothetical protein
MIHGIRHRRRFSSHRRGPYFAPCNLTLGLKRGSSRQDQGQSQGISIIRDGLAKDDKEKLTLVQAGTAFRKRSSFTVPIMSDDPHQPTDETTQKQEKFTFTNLYLELFEPLISSILIFAVADLRKVVQSKQNHRESVSGNIFRLPLAGPDVVQILDRNKDMLRSAVKANAYDTVRLIVSEEFRQQNMFQDIRGITLHHVGDDRANQECVYGISTSDTRKRIAVVFRGSTT